MARYKHWWYPYINSMVRVYTEGKRVGTRADEVYVILNQAYDQLKPQEKVIVDDIKSGLSYISVASKRNYSVRQVQRVWNGYINTVGKLWGI